MDGFGPVGELFLVGVVILDGFTAADRPIAKVALVLFGKYRAFH